MSNILFFDTETTGLIAGKSSVIEIGAVYYHDGVEHSRFNVKCNRDVNTDINIGALHVNRTSPSDLEKSKEPKEAAYEFVEYLLSLPARKGSIVLAGHNVNFDINHTDAFLKTYGIVDFKDFVSYRSIDTAAIGQFLIDAGILNTDRSNLSAVAKALDLDCDEKQHHEALYDAELSAKAYFKMKELVRAHTGVTQKKATWL